MTLPLQEMALDNTLWAGASPELSVLVPVYRDDPGPLLASLAEQAPALGGAVELVVLDDGSSDDGLAVVIAEALQAAPCPARFVRLLRNEGRSRGRNRLARNARSGSLLFLDSDMLPDGPDFLARWLEIARGGAAVVFGGFSLDQAPERADTALHRRMASRSDCAPAAARAEAPEKHVCTSNLLIRRDVFEAEPFDEAFSGWGWEDVEWAARAARRWPVEHVDNTATHLGLDTAETLARKYEQSAANFGRFAATHAEVVASYPSFRAARLLKRLPARGAWRPLLKRVALSGLAPVAVRAFSMRLYRAALYAEAV